MSGLKDKYIKNVIPAMREKFGYKNKMAVPRLEKVTLNSSFGKMASAKAGEDAAKLGQAIAEDIALIAGQKPVVTTARKSIATFKLRQGAPLGVKVTLRGQKMYDFLDRLVHVVLPRSRDFRGLSPSSIDNQGNLNIGIGEHLFFPEISPERSKVPFGLEVTVTISAKSREEGLEMFRQLGFPFGAS
ncbi:MAG: 50S ribosomal protein L5 [Candidatus Wildermuthbacteria bacterium RIFCSPHIGHO2_02_FULL_49_9]|uniref:Large ribosomal subunit protein uL5 n=2 Tax=Candidatus Wildermuthiibacteriota TaxID=1817923 RepID=A0A1G2QWB9_9BACT|nr:MAG: 50S ribosomal protein L5 [Candidatus Wildermuthbacteria bacterium RIFCSPHIGHO2_01_FULL_49_22b]OHA70075.1 MAG: 50S ribosomal protein L5 [Candidatus Wildermuthbacteria bacterium RIFCSPHIGHO2_02_FULL_49_9]